MAYSVRTLIVAFVAATSTLLSAAVHAESTTRKSVLTEPMPASRDHVPARGKPGSGLVGRFDATALSAGSLEVMLADGRSAIAQAQRIERDPKGVVRAWTGTFADSPGSVLALTRTRGAVAGFANYDGRAYELLPTADGRHVLFEVDARRLPQARDVFDTNLKEAPKASGADAFAAGDAAATTTAAATGATTTATSGFVVHDVLIYYTPAAANRWGGATSLESMVHSALQAANFAYQNSQVRVALNLVGFRPSPVSEGGSMSQTVNALKSNATARAARDSLAADMVLVMAENTEVCGYAQLWYSWSGSTTNWDAYAGAYAGCLSTQVLAHELAHLEQLDHNIEQAAGFAPYPYSYGYRVCTTGGFRDIMSYPCSMDVARINYFSNPNLTYNGYALGNAQSADGARSLNETAAMVAAYRGGGVSSTVPAAPGSLAATSVKFDRVALSWNDNSTNESGFKVQRSVDGVNFSVVASLGANAAAYADTGVNPATTYYYRVLAYNGAGNSGASNLLSVRTPVAAPAAPSNVSAANGANGTATVRWTDNSGNETRFDIQRSKWDAVKRTWLPRTSLGSVGANVTRFVDASGKGKFRYYVRAANASGASVYSGPAQVTVTGG